MVLLRHLIRTWVAGDSLLSSLVGGLNQIVQVSSNPSDSRRMINLCRPERERENSGKIDRTTQTVTRQTMLHVAHFNPQSGCLKLICDHKWKRETETEMELLPGASSFLIYALDHLDRWIAVNDRLFHSVWMENNGGGGKTLMNVMDEMCRRSPSVWRQFLLNRPRIDSPMSDGRCDAFSLWSWGGGDSCTTHWGLIRGSWHDAFEGGGGEWLKWRRIGDRWLICSWWKCEECWLWFCWFCCKCIGLCCLPLLLWAKYS